MSDTAPIPKFRNSILDENGNIMLDKMVDPAYHPILHDRHFRVIIKGAKGSGKSVSMCRIWLYRLSKYPLANLVVVRKVQDTIRNSCFAEMKKAIVAMELSSVWEAKESLLEIRNKYTGQKIIFKGMDKAEKLMSLTVDVGVLNFVWFEEFYEINSEEEYNKFEMSIRGEIPDGYFKQIVCTFNPWSEQTWIKPRFFDNTDELTSVYTTTWKDNLHLDDVDKARYIKMYQDNPRGAKVMCDGEWGIMDGLVYDNWEVLDFNILDVMKNNPYGRTSFGLDFGFAVSYNAFVALYVDVNTRQMWVFDEMYERGMTNMSVAKKITQMRYNKETIYADPANPQNIAELAVGVPEEVELSDGSKTVINWALPNICSARKGPDSVNRGIQEIQTYKIWVHPKCINYIIELNSYCWEKDKDDKFTGKPIKEFDHLMDATRYAMEKFYVAGGGAVVGPSDELLPKNDYNRIREAGPLSSGYVFSTL